MMDESKKEYLTVSEMAKLCNVSVATLKHYDRIGLLKPERVDRSNSYRYYSICQYAQIETIRELRELHIPINSIKAYMSNRNIPNSLAIIKQQYSQLQEKMNELSEIKNCIETQIELLENVLGKDDFCIREEEFGERKILLSNLDDMFDLNTRTEIDVSYAILTVEMLHGRTEKALTLARGRLGLFIPQEELEKGNLMKSVPFIFLRDDKTYANKGCVKTLSGGKYVCLHHKGPAERRKPYLQQIMEYIEEHNLKIAGDAIHINLVDDTLSDNPDDYLFDIQIPVVSS